jgi:putative ABC transport system substrate-binding protein
MFKFRKTSIILGTISCIFNFISPAVLFAQDKQATIIVIMSSGVEPYQIALKGFKDELAKQGIAANYNEYDLKGDSEEVDKDAVLQKLKVKSCDLILTVGSGATTFVKGKIEDKPVVFSMVLNPVASGFISTMEVGRNSNIAGASMDIPVKKQFSILKSSIPYLKRIVAFYNPRETEAVIRRAQSVAEEFNFSFEAIPISSEKDIINSLNKLTGKQDALWAVADSRVYTPQNTQFIILETLRSGIPFIGISSSFVKAGALISFSCNYRENGQQAAGLAVRILNGESPSNLAIATPEKIEISVNANTAKHIKVQLPENILKEAVNIF